MAVPESSSSFKYDVFLSFRGTDTRRGFTGFLFKALHDRGINTFFDAENLQRGELIAPSLVKAIEESRLFIIVFSKSYAASSFCLDELAMILECSIQRKVQLVFPVFYDVDPSDVRHQTGTYGEAFAEHEERYKDNKEKVQNWRKALRQAAELVGWHFKYGEEYEYKLIKKIVDKVCDEINNTPLHVTDYPVGLKSRMRKVIWLLDARSNDGVYMVGICGVAGIGKTTLARAVYNSTAPLFEASCFLGDVRENSMKYGLEHLQKTLLYQTVGEKDIQLASVSEAIPIIKHKLQRKKVLLVLDDVDKLEQLHALVGELDWFGSGSKVIIVTRDKHLLASHGVERIYEVEKLTDDEALELLSWNAFKTDKVYPEFADKLIRAITYASGLPLALKVIGLSLFGKGIEEWESALDLYEKVPNKDTQKILELSFDTLDDDQKFAVTGSQPPTYQSSKATRVDWDKKEEKEEKLDRDAEH